MGYILAVPVSIAVCCLVLSLYGYNKIIADRTHSVKSKKENNPVKEHSSSIAIVDDSGEEIKRDSTLSRSAVPQEAMLSSSAPSSQVQTFFKYPKEATQRKGFADSNEVVIPLLNKQNYNCHASYNDRRVSQVSHMNDFRQTN